MLFVPTAQKVFWHYYSPDITQHASANAPQYHWSDELQGDLLLIGVCVYTSCFRVAPCSVFLWCSNPIIKREPYGRRWYYMIQARSTRMVSLKTSLSRSLFKYEVVPRFRASACFHSFSAFVQWFNSLLSCPYLTCWHDSNLLCQTTFISFFSMYIQFPSHLFGCLDLSYCTTTVAVMEE